MLRNLLVLIAAGFVAACSLSPTDYNGAGAPTEAAIQPLRSERPLVALALGSGHSNRLTTRHASVNYLTS